MSFKYCLPSNRFENLRERDTRADGDPVLESICTSKSDPDDLLPPNFRVSDWKRLYVILNSPSEIVKISNSLEMCVNVYWSTKGGESAENSRDWTAVKRRNQKHFPTRSNAFHFYLLPISDVE